MIAQCKTTLVSRTRIPQRGICKKAPKISADRTRPRTILCTMERPSMEAISHDATRAAHPASAPAAVLASPAPAPDSPTLRAPSTLRTARPPRPLLVPLSEVSPRLRRVDPTQGRGLRPRAGLHVPITYTHDYHTLIYTRYTRLFSLS